MAYDPDPAATHNPTLDVIVPVNWLDLINANFAEIGAAWTSFTPAMTFAGGGSLTIGNGTLTGAYRQIGKTLTFRIHLTAGTTTSFGTGTFRFTLPNSLSAAATGKQVVVAYVQDLSTRNYAGVAQVAAGSTYATVSVDNSTADVDSVTPFSWGNGDFLVIEGSIEVA